jgi:hypothetical protein
MSIKVTNRTDIEVHTHTVVIEFEGAEPMTWQGFSHKGKTVVPVRAKASYKHGQPIKVITLYVRVCKKDGTVGNAETEHSFETPHSTSWGTRWGTNAPAWLLELFGIEVPA